MRGKCSVALQRGWTWTCRTLLINCLRAQTKEAQITQVLLLGRRASWAVDVQNVSTVSGLLGQTRGSLEQRMNKAMLLGVVAFH